MQFYFDLGYYLVQWSWNYYPANMKISNPSILVIGYYLEAGFCRFDLIMDIMIILIIMII